MTSVLRHRDTQGGGDHMKTGREIRVMQPQAKKHLEPPEAMRGEEVLSPRADTLILDFSLPELRISFCFSH